MRVRRGHRIYMKGLHIVAWLFGILCFETLTACTDDDNDDGGGSDAGSATEGLFITWDIDDMEATTYTRATDTESSWSDWNEDLLERLDVFIYKRGDLKSKTTTYSRVITYVEHDEITSGKVHEVRYTDSTYTRIVTETYSTSEDGTTTSSTTDTDWEYVITSQHVYSCNVSKDTCTSTSTTIGETDTTVVYSYDYAFKYHASTEYTSTDWQLKYSDNGTIPATWLEATDSVFIVANDVSNFSSCSDSASYATAFDTPEKLRALSATYYNSSDDYAYTTQTEIMMSGCVQAVNSTSNSNIITDSDDAYGNPKKRTVKVPLTRACAKIRLHVWFKAEDADYYTTQKTFSDNNAQVRLIHYTTAGPLFENGTYNNTADTTSTLYSNSPQMYGGTLTVTSSNQSIYGGTAGETVDDYSAVYYVFPNNWYDSSKSMYEEAPINYDYWTHFLIAVTDTKAAMEYKYEYSIPINYLLPEDNDALNPDPSYIDLYNIYRNHVYNVNVYVQEQAEGYIVTLSIEDLTEGTTIEISSDDDTSASVTIESLDTSDEYDYIPSD